MEEVQRPVKRKGEPSQKREKGCSGKKTALSMESHLDDKVGAGVRFFNSTLKSQYTCSLIPVNMRPKHVKS